MDEGSVRRMRGRGSKYYCLARPELTLSICTRLDRYPRAFFTVLHSFTWNGVMLWVTSPLLVDY